MANDDEFDVEIVTELSDNHWDGIAQLYVDEEWFMFSKEMVEISKKFSWSKAVVAVNQKGRVVGLLTWTEAPNATVHYVSTYLVAEAYRGRGIGHRLWDEMMKRVTPGRILGIDADPDMADKYRSQDFPYHSNHGAYRISFSTATALAACEKVFNRAQEENTALAQVVPLSNEHIERVIAYDQDISGRNRESFLREYFKLSYVTARVALLQDKVVGFCCRVPTQNDSTMRLGPLLADNMVIGVALLSQVCDFAGHLSAIRPHRDECPFLQFLLQHTDCKVDSAARRSFSRKCPDEDAVDRSRVFAFTAHSCQPDC